MKRTLLILSLLICFAGATQAQVVRRPIPVTAGSCGAGVDIGNGWCQIANTVSGTTSTATTTSAINTTGADLIVLVIASYCGNQTMASTDVSDSKSNTWTSVSAGLCDGAGFQDILMVYTKPSSVGSGHTFTVTTGTATYPVLAVYAVSGSHATPLDQTASSASGASTVTTKSPGSITPTQNNELVISGWTLLAVNTGTPTASGMTVSGFFNSDGVNYQTGGLAYVTQSTAAAINPTWSWVTSGVAYAAIASFKHS